MNKRSISKSGSRAQAQSIPYLAVLSACVISSGALGGELLRLKAGNVALKDASGQILDQASLVDSTSQVRNFVIQFSRKITEADKAQLRSRGLEVKGYLPDDALIVKGEAAGVALTPSSVAGVRAVSNYLPDWKLSTELAPLAGLGGISQSLLSIRTLSDDETKQVASELNLLPGVSLHEASGRAIVATVPADRIAQVSRIDGIEWIQEMPIMQTMDLEMPLADQAKAHDSFSLPTPTGFESGAKVMGFEAAWQRGFTGQGQIAAMADTGTDLGQVGNMHQDLSNVIKGYAMGLLVFSWADPMGHGTHVTGSVVSTGKASGGVIKGGAYGAHFISTGMWNTFLNNLLVESDFNKLMGTPYNDGARIHTNSWGSPNNAYDNFAAQADDFMWNHPDMLVLFAAGNGGQDLDKDGRIDEGSVSSPGTAKNVLSVGASENKLDVGGIQKMHKDLKDGDKKWAAEPIASDTVSNNVDGLACFSSRGPTSDGRIKPDIVAPGTNIVSTRSRNPKAELLWGEYDANYLYSGGTSMATPLAAGAATVTREYLVKARGIANPSAALVKATLMHTAHDMYPGQYGEGPKQELPAHRPNVHEGYGRVDMDQATNLTVDTTIADNGDGVAVNEVSAPTVVALKQGEGLRATLVYTDAPAVAGAAKALVNDIDLQIITPSGQVFEKADRVNNAEMLELSNLAEGDYKIQVKGINVPQGRNGKQPYALVISRVH